MALFLSLTQKIYYVIMKMEKWKEEGGVIYADKPNCGNKSGI